MYSRSLTKRTSTRRNRESSYHGRDMWVATLLDCDFEPAKVRFGPAKIIPADRNFYKSEHKEHFSHHMESK